jgi:hypothetical protein
MPDILFPSGFPNATLPLAGGRYFILNDERVTLDQVAEYIGVTTTSTFIWRPTEPSPRGNVFANWVDLAAAAGGAKGRVVVVLDVSLSTTFQIPAAVYPFACTRLVFSGAGNSQVSFMDNGAANPQFTGGNIRTIELDLCALEWRGQHLPLLPVTGSTFGFAVGAGARLLGHASSLVPMISIGETVGITVGANATVQAAGHELFTIAATKSLYVVPSNGAQISAGCFRGAGGVGYLVDSNAGASYSPTQPNLSGGVAVLDSALNGAPYLRLLQALSTRMVTGSGAVVSTDNIILVNNGMSTTTMTLPPAVVGITVRFVKWHSQAQTTALTPNGTDTINNVNATYTLPYSADIEAIYGEWLLTCYSAGSWTVAGWGQAVQEIAQRGRTLPARAGSTGSLWLGDGNLNDAISGRTLTSVATRYSADRNKTRQFLFAGAQAYTQNNAALRAVGSMTVEVVLQGFATNAFQWILSHDTLATRRYYLGISNQGNLFWGFDDTGGAARDIVTEAPILYQRNHIVARRTVAVNTFLELFVNGRLIMSQTFVAQTPINTGVNNNLYFGQNSGATERLGSATSFAHVSQLYIDPGVLWTDAEILSRARMSGCWSPT